jgi:hypothetical protein
MGIADACLRSLSKPGTLAFDMGKRGPKPLGRVKAKVSLEPDQLMALRFVAGYLSAFNGQPIDVSGVVRFAVLTSPVVKQVLEDGRKVLSAAGKLVAERAAFDSAMTALREGGRIDDRGLPADEDAFRQVFERIARVDNPALDEWFTARRGAGREGAAAPRAQEQQRRAKPRKGAKP